jgi:hypothetical protein
MAYIGRNPRLKSIVSQGDTLANLTAEPRVAGRLVWATDELKFYYDDGTTLNVVGSGEGGGGGGVPLLSKGGLITSDGSNNGELAVGTDGQILVVDDSEVSGLKWIDPPSVPPALDINGLDEKITPVDDDILIIEDSADAFNKKKLKISSLPSGGGGGYTFNNGVIEVANSDVIVASNAPTLTGLLYFRAPAAIKIVKVQVELFTLDGVSSGILSLDVKKNTTPEDSGMASIMDTEAEIDFSTAANYDIGVGVIDPLLEDLAENDVIRVDVTSKPVGVTKFRITIIGGAL